MSKHYHFIGIGGIGMGAIASLLLSKGFRVSGSDAQENKMTAKLKQDGATVYLGHAASQVNGADYVIYSSAIDPDNVEIKQAKEKKIPILQRARLLAELMQDHVGVTIAGAHGKTTTTSMVSNLLTKAGLNPTTAVGGIVSGISSNARLGSGNYFVSEVDESDGSFLYFSPKYSVVTNIDLEHIDYYKNWDNILKAHQEYLSKTEKNGMNFICGDDDRLVGLAQKSGKPFVTYGFDEKNDIYAKNILLDKFTSSYELFYKGKNFGTVELNVPGRHNILNSMACAGIGIVLSLPFPVIQGALKDFRGVNRRFQVIDQIDDICVVDDYGHHPTEINATLQVANKAKSKRLITVFQPHRYSRLSALWDEFAKSLLQTDYLIITDVYAASEKPIDGVTSQKLADLVRKNFAKPVFCLKKDEIIAHVIKIVKPGDLVLMLGAGDITKIADQLAKSLRSQYHASAK